MDLFTSGVAHLEKNKLENNNQMTNESSVDNKYQQRQHIENIYEDILSILENVMRKWFFLVVVGFLAKGKSELHVVLNNLFNAQHVDNEFHI